MHELSIALDLVDLACEEAGRLGNVRVRALHLRIGVLSGIVSDALRFSFDVAAAGTPIEGARLEIETVPVSVWCAPCSEARTVASPHPARCPVCSSPTSRISSGDTLELTALEVVDGSSPDR